MLDKVPEYLLTPGLQSSNTCFDDVLKMTETDYLEALNKATNGGVVEAVKLKANTTAEQFKIIEDQKDEPDLKSAQDFVGGIVECITFPNGDLVIINEEGKLINFTFKPRGNSVVAYDL